MVTTADLADSVRAALLTQFSRGELNLPIPPELMQPPSEPEKSGFCGWIVRHAQSKANADALELIRASACGTPRLAS